MKGQFILTSPDQHAVVVLPPGAPGPVRLAAADLVSDIEKRTGFRLETTPDIPDNRTPALRISWTGDGPPESHSLHSSPDGRVLELSGAGARGAAYAIYTFCERFLDIEPCGYWMPQHTERVDRLSWPEIHLDVSGPRVPRRGLFINDEDLLTEWKSGGGLRDIDYPFYRQVAAPEAMERVYETLLRLKMNLVIPASFVDIRNPDEKRLLDLAAARGLVLSMHHVEPLGVSAFAFQNYWRRQNREVPFAFHRDPKPFEEIWRHYAEAWAEYPEVIWQIGLRGIADRPFWMADKDAPASEAERGAVISDAMRRQAAIIREMTGRPDPEMTTTLWAEGARLHEQGHLRIPEGVVIVHSDNNPGWYWPPAVADTVRRHPRHRHGIYYHHAVWSTGPHLAQAVSPARCAARHREALEMGADAYAILNAANLREFVLGLRASANALWNPDCPDDDGGFKTWCDYFFGLAGPEVHRLYTDFFNSYALAGDPPQPALLDGRILQLGGQVIDRVRRRREGREDGKSSADAEWAGTYLGGMNPNAPLGPADLMRLATEQAERLARAESDVEALLPRLPETTRDFFTANALGQIRLLRHLTQWLATLLACERDLADGRPADPAALMKEVDAAREALALSSTGTFQDWHRGDRKMNLDERMEGATLRFVREQSDHLL